MRPTADVFGQVIDCRKLLFRVYFYDLTEDEVRKLSESYYTFVNSEFGEDSIFLWKMQNRVIKQADNIRNTELDKRGDIDIEFLGDIRSSRVYNKTTLRAHEKNLEYTVFYTSGIESVDYSRYKTEELDPYCKTPDKFKSALIKLFSLEDRIFQNHLRDNDFEGWVLSDRMQFKNKLIRNEDCYSGKIILRISCYCLDNEIDEMADKLYEYGLKLSSEFNSVNIGISIQADMSCDERFFGSHRFSESASFNDDEGMKMRYLSEYFYMRYVGWANIISPIVAGLLKSKDNNSVQEGIQKCTLTNGAVILRVNKRISETKLSDLKKLRSEMYPALFAGMSKYPLDFPFRERWENTPVLDDEITVTDNEVIFSHKGYLDKDYLLNGVIPED